MSSIINADTTDGVKITSDTSGELKLQSAGTDTVTVKSDGKVGIGTTTPQSPLEIQSDDDISMNASGTGHLEIDGNGYNFAIALDADAASIYTNSSARDLVFGTNETERMRIDGTGRVIIAGQGYSPTLTLTDGATINWDTDSGQVATVTLAGNRTFAAPTNLVNGGFYALEIVQDATGSRTATWNSVFKFTGATAPTLTTTASAKDYLVFRSDGTNLYEQGRSLGVG